MRRYRNGVGDLAPGLTLPTNYQQKLRARLADIEDANSPVNTEGARREAIGMVGGLELAKALDSSQIEQLYLMIEDAATARLLQLEQDSTI